MDRLSKKKLSKILNIFLLIIMPLSILIFIYIKSFGTEWTDKSELSSLIIKFNEYDEYGIESFELKDEFNSLKAFAEKILYNNKASQEEVKDIIDNLNAMMTSVHNFLFESVYLKANNFALVSDVYINGIKCAFDKNSETFYFPLDMDKLENININIKCSGEPEQNIYAVIQKDNEVILTSFNVLLNEAYILKAISSQYVYEYNIVFTGLPIIQINDAERIGESYKDCSFSLIDPSFSYKADYENHLFFETGAKIKIRGGISRSFPKNSYSLKLVTENGDNKDYSMLGLRSDSDYILDAMYIDKARSRNRVCTDIWNNFSALPEYSKILEKDFVNGTNGEFVEVFLNNEYWGLYCLTEKIDRKQLQLARYNEYTETIHGVIYKGYTWDSIISFKEYRAFDNNHATWGGWEQKFPNPNNQYPVKWEPMANIVNFYMNASDEEFRDNIKNYMDLDVFIDYTILMCITYASDNTGKNAYWSFYDIKNSTYNKVFITPWDFDASFGRTWESSKMMADSEWMDTIGGHDTTLFRRLVLTNADGFKDKLVARWNSLKNNKLSVESMIQYFDDYFDLFEKSGAFEREKNKWKECELNLQEEKEYIYQWIKDRFAYIDNYMNNNFTEELQKVHDKHKQ